MEEKRNLWTKKDELSNGHHGHHGPWLPTTQTVGHSQRVFIHRWWHQVITKSPNGTQMVVFQRAVVKMVKFRSSKLTQKQPYFPQQSVTTHVRLRGENPRICRIFRPSRPRRTAPASFGISSRCLVNAANAMVETPWISSKFDGTREKMVERMGYRTNSMILIPTSRMNRPPVPQWGYQSLKSRFWGWHSRFCS